MKWYEERHIIQQNWILEHLADLHLSSQEAIMVFVIEFLNRYHERVDTDILSRKCGMSVRQTEKVLAELCQKQYLKIRFDRGRYIYELNGLYESDFKPFEQEDQLLKLFELEFKRPLKQWEKDRINQWRQTMDDKFIMYALRKSSAYHGLNINYVQSVLDTWIRAGVTTEMMDRGLRG